MKRRSWSKPHSPTTLSSIVVGANGYHACVFPNTENGWYGLVQRVEPCDCVHTSQYPGSGWSERKTKRKALKHLFRLPKRN